MIPLMILFSGRVSTYRNSTASVFHFVFEITHNETDEVCAHRDGFLEGCDGPFLRGTLSLQ